MQTQPFTALTPDAVLDALDSIGLRSDGRLLALNSYENRVYQAGMEDGPPLVAKFYRPARWPDAARYLGTAERVAALAPIPSFPLAQSRRHVAGLVGRVFEPDRYLPAHRWLPVHRPLTGLQCGDVQRTPDSAVESDPVEEDACTVDDPRGRYG